MYFCRIFAFAKARQMFILISAEADPAAAVQT